MTHLLTLSAGATAIISAALFNFNQDSLGLFFAIATVVLFSLSSLSYIKYNTYEKHTEERKILFNAALEIIDARTRLTIDLVGEFNGLRKKYEYSLSKEQEDFISNLYSAAWDVRSNDVELKDNTLTKDERSICVKERRMLLDKMEKARPVIEQYLREST